MCIYHPRRREPVTSPKSPHSETKAITPGESRWGMHNAAFHEVSIFVRRGETRKPLNLAERTLHAKIH